MLIADCPTWVDTFRGHQGQLSRQGRRPSGSWSPHISCPALAWAWGLFSLMEGQKPARAAFPSHSHQRPVTRLLASCERAAPPHRHPAVLPACTPFEAVSRVAGLLGAPTHPAVGLFIHPAKHAGSGAPAYQELPAGTVTPSPARPPRALGPFLRLQRRAEACGDSAPRLLPGSQAAVLGFSRPSGKPEEESRGPWAASLTLCLEPGLSWAQGSRLSEPQSPSLNWWRLSSRSIEEPVTCYLL